jgi:hypothetical protein
MSRLLFSSIKHNDCRKKLTTQEAEERSAKRFPQEAFPGMCSLSLGSHLALRIFCFSKEMDSGSPSAT